MADHVSPKKRRLRRRMILAAVVGTTTTVALIPTLLGILVPPLANSGQFEPGSCTLSGLRLAWLRPTRLERIEWQGADGAARFVAAGIRTDLGFAGLLRCWAGVGGLGTIDVAEAWIEVDSAEGCSAAVGLARRLEPLLKMPTSGRVEVHRILARAEAFGLAIDSQGKGRVAFEIRDGGLAGEPAILDLNKGTLQLGRWMLEPDSRGVPTFSAEDPIQAKGIVVDDGLARLLAYITPALQGAVGASGEASFDIVSARIPIEENLENIEAEGSSRLRVEFRPARGSIVHRTLLEASRRFDWLAEILPDKIRPAPTGADSPLVNLTMEQLEFRVAEGKVYQEDQEIPIGPATLRLDGSVGLADGRLELDTSLGLWELRAAAKVSGTLSDPAFQGMRLEGMSEAASSIVDHVEGLTQGLSVKAKDLLQPKVDGEDRESKGTASEAP